MTINFWSLVLRRCPVYEVDLNESVYTSYNYDYYNRRYIFTVEQGTRFYLKLKLTANPMPSSAELSKDGCAVKSSRYATIYISVDRMCIPTVYGASYGGVYTIICRSTEGEGRISFELKVKGT